MREPRPVISWHDAHQLLLDFHRIVLASQFEEPGETLDVRIHHDSFILLEPRAEDHVRRLAPHARQVGQLFHSLRHFATMAFHQRLGHPDDRPGLVAEEAGGLDFLLEDLGISGGVVGGGAVLREQMWRDDVDARVGALR